MDTKQTKIIMLQRTTEYAGNIQKKNIMSLKPSAVLQGTELFRQTHIKQCQKTILIVNTPFVNTQHHLKHFT
jgi:hypothetical protein